MSWRRFQVLVKGLSPTSATVAKLNSHHQIGGGKRGERVNSVVGPKAAQAAFDAAFKPADTGRRARKKK